MSKQDITTLDEEAQRMSVLWDKAMNFLASFNHAFCENRNKFEAGIYPPEWHYNRWLLAKVGLSEKTCLRVISTVAQYARLGDQERERERLQQIQQEKKAERDRRKAEEQAAKTQRAAARTEREAKQAKPPQPQLKLEPVSPKPRRGRPPNAPLREKAVEAVLAVMATGQPVNKYQISRETGILHGVLDVAMGIAQERFKQAPMQKTNGGHDPLAARADAAWAKIDRGDELWIEGVMELANVMAEARIKFTANQEFGHWLERNNLERNKDERAALINLGYMGHEQLRDLLKHRCHNSIQLIWQDFRQGRVLSTKNTTEAPLQS